MNTKHLTWLSIAVIALLAALLLSACKPQTLCPVMGGKVDKAIFADVGGCRVYFCCGECVETFKKDPAKYLKVIKDNGESPEKVAASCPLKKSE